MSIPKDKVLHALVGAVIGGVCGAAGTVVGGFALGVIVGSVLATIAGVGKEVYDERNGGVPDKYDAIATIVAGVVFSFIGASII